MKQSSPKTVRSCGKANVRQPKASNDRDIMQQRARHPSVCLAGDTELQFDLPGGVRRRGNQLYKLTVEEVYQRFQPTRNARPDRQRYPFFKRDRVRQMLLRCMDRLSEKPTHTHIVDIWQNSIEPVYRVRLKDGSSATVSKDHIFYTSGGWLSLQDAVSLPVRRERVTESRVRFAALSRREGIVVEPQWPTVDETREEWRPIIDWEGWYEVSNFGRVRRIARGRGVLTAVQKCGAGRPNFAALGR